MNPNPDKLSAFRRELDREFVSRFPRSHAFLDVRGRHLLDQTSHAVRWAEPFMVTVSEARGAFLRDLDGHEIIDYWQGHMANILGHNPPWIRSALSDSLQEGHGLQTGMLHEIEQQLAELVCRLTGQESVRFTTTGSLGTFYATLLARGFTGRLRVVKVAGGWHGSQPFGLKGVAAKEASFDHAESEGLSQQATDEILLVRFNDVEGLQRTFREHGDEIACFILEPSLGAGGGLPSSPEFLGEARRLTEEHGALLICDEIITGFRFHAGPLSALYGVTPDLLILGKILGGGMPVAAVAGRREVLELCSRKVDRVKFEGGTYSAHPLSLLAAKTMLEFLEKNQSEVYENLGQLGERARKGLRECFAKHEVPAYVPDAPPTVKWGSSLVYVHPRQSEDHPTCAETLAKQRHPWLDAKLLRTAMLLQDVSCRYGCGSITAAHTETEIDRTVAAYEATLGRMRDAGLFA